MTITYSFQPNLVTFLFEGRQTLEETKTVFAQAFDHTDFPVGANVLIDARQSVETRSSSELSSLAALFFMRRGRVGPKCALVVGEMNKNQEEYERILSSFSDRYSVRFFVFFTEEDARAWLSEPLPAA